jgi:hypothetical protein
MLYLEYATANGLTTGPMFKEGDPGKVASKASTYDWTNIAPLLSNKAFCSRNICVVSGPNWSIRNMIGIMTLLFLESLMLWSLRMVLTTMSHYWIVIQI